MIYEDLTPATLAAAATARLGGTWLVLSRAELMGAPLAHRHSEACYGCSRQLGYFLTLVVYARYVGSDRYEISTEMTYSGQHESTIYDIPAEDVLGDKIAAPATVQEWLAAIQTDCAQAMAALGA